MNPNATDSSMPAVVVLVLVLFYLAMIVFGIYMYCRVAAKAGWSPWAGLWMIVPIANLVFMIMFVFSKWPIERELEMLRGQLAYAGQAPSSRFGTLPAGGYGTADGAPAYPDAGGYLGGPGYGTAPGWQGQPPPSGPPVGGWQ